MRVLVTGGTSLIGRSVASRLAEHGHEVVLFQRRPSESAFPDYLGTVEDRTAVDTAMEGVDGVIHLAAKVGVTGERAEYEAVNIRGTGNVIESARSHGVRRFVHVSSPSVAHTGRPVMGGGANPPDPVAATGHYSQTKALAEMRALAASGPEMSVVAIRPHIVWGPGDTQLIGRIVERARQGRLALVGTGAALIDTTYVDNAADALIAALDRSPTLAGRALVVSNGEPRTVAELIERIVRAARLDAPRRRVPKPIAAAGGALAEAWWDRTRRRDDPPMTRFLAEQLSTAHWFDQRETRRALDWQPRVTLDEGFRMLDDWFAKAASG